MDFHPKAKACLGKLIIKEEQKHVVDDEDYYEIPEPECEIKQEKYDLNDPLMEQFDDKSRVHEGKKNIKKFVKLQHELIF